jgi:hypothetical protein
MRLDQSWRLVQSACLDITFAEEKIDEGGNGRADHHTAHQQQQSYQTHLLILLNRPQILQTHYFCPLQKWDVDFRGYSGYTLI